MRATIFEVNKLDGNKTYIGDTSSDDFLLLTIFAERTLSNYIRSLSKRLGYEYWEIHHGYGHHESIPKCVNAIVFCFKERGNLSKGICKEKNEVTYFFQIEDPKE